MGPQAILPPLVMALAIVGCRPNVYGRDDADSTRARSRMVSEQIEARGVKDPATLGAMRTVPRQAFVPPSSGADAYGDHPLAIGHGQTISQPYIVAFMTEALGLKKGATVLEVGTGSGYQAAVLAQIADRVYSVEILPALADEARSRLDRLGYRNVQVRVGDGYQGWPEAGPFDGIIVTAAAPRVPDPLKSQLKDGGRLVIPVGDESQELMVVTRRGDTFEERRILPVRFVPMTGKVRQ
ncbi:MAG TPA: protein-L-isoaspartate(D-aspartate) O-methyltransferase [Vicinamibacteria bacterium]|nr:protein-L-isoaspartate(D-aspartate) O-methyltransferase [Vicinamibacteria bacterium]